MKFKYTKLFLTLLVAFSSMIPFELVNISAEESYVVVDDTEVDSANENYFTYTEASDPKGITGWVASKKETIQGDDAAKTEHWVWNENVNEASKHTYTFTFVGTGVELVGVKSDDYNNFQLDGGTIEEVAISGANNTPTVLYSKKNLEYKEHIVSVTMSQKGATRNGLQISYAKVYGSKMEQLEKSEISHKKTTGESNKFIFSERGWSSGNDEHVWSEAPSENLPASDIYYEVKFVGSQIDVYAGKNKPMGKVEYFIDDVSKGKYSLYNNGNINSALIASFKNLSEGEHTLKAVATGERDTNSTNAQIDCSKVVVYHKPYVINDLILASDTYRLQEGANQQITYTVNPDYATIDDMMYTSANETVATVNSSGLIEAVGTGNTTIALASKKYNLNKEVSVEVIEATPQIGGSIVDTNTQYTQTRYEEVKNLGLVSKSLSAWKNDAVTSEIAVIAKDSKLKNVSVTASDLTDGNHTISKEHVKATFIKETKAYNGGYLGYGDANRKIPVDNGKNRSLSSDILYQSTPIDVAYNKVQPIWVEFAIPNDAQAGTYTSTITVSADGIKEPLTFEYTVTVQDVVLPEANTYKDSFDIELWQYPYSSAEYYDVTPFSKKHFEILTPMMEKYKSMGGHAITTTISEEAWNAQTYSKNEVHYPSMVKWIKNSDGTFTYDYTSFDKWVQFNKDLGIGDKIILYSIAPWHNSFTYWENDRLVYERYTVGSERYKKVWKDFLGDMIEHLMAKGWFDETYVGIDERGFDKAAFDLVDSVRNIHDKPLKTAGAMDHFVEKHDLALRVTDLNVGDNAAAAHPAKFTQLLKERTAKGYRTTLYSCTEHQPGNFSLSAPVESYYTMVNAGEETAGFLRWAYDAWVEDPLRDATHNAFEPGDTFMIYPDEKDVTNPMFKSSVRLERMAEGVRDVNKIKMMVAQIPGLQAEVDAMYNKLTFHATTSRSYLSADRIAQLSKEMDTFKEDLTNLTKRYIELKQTGTNEVESVTISESNQTISMGNSLQLHAKVNPSNVLNTAVKWSSSNDKVVSVNDTGVISGLKLGKALISATSLQDPSKSASIEISVKVANIDEGLQVAYYSFDNQDVKDQWGQRDGTINGATFEKGKSGNALKADEINNVTFAQASGINENDDWSISYWVKSNVAINKRTSVIMDANKDYSADLKLAENRSAGFHVGKRDVDVLTSTYTFEQDTWYNVTWTQSKSDGLTMYVNGKKIQTNAWTKTNKIIAPLDILGGTGFDGYIDELKVYNTALNATQVNAAMVVNGLNLTENNKTLFINDTYDIETNLISDKEDKSITYISSNPEVASVDEQGRVSAKTRGETTITVKNEAGGYVETLLITVNKKLSISSTLKQYELDEKFLSDIEKAPGTDRQYLGQPDMVRTSTGRLISAYPVGHGHGPIVMQISDNDGKTWTEKKDIPASWEYCQETPTLYVLNLADGTERIMLISACPPWDLNKGGWETSYSDDNGNTWTEYQHFHANLPDGTKNSSVVGMASLVQLKDESGNFIQKWMGVYHTMNYVNYKTYLTFDDNGNEVWSVPEAYLSEYRDIEKQYQICEVGMFRSPDGKRIVGLARSQSHNNPATLIYSDDEGKTWSKPMDLPGSLAGERHKVVYDPISNRLVVTFREIKHDLNGNNQFDGNTDWTCGEWIAWVGTYEDLMEQNDGEYTFIIANDYSNNAKSGDTGYAGVVVLEDGTFIMNSYGHWDKEFSQSWPNGVTSDLCYIKQAKFKLGDIENANHLVSRKQLNTLIEEVKNIDATMYTKDSFAVFSDALTKAMKISEDNISQQVEVNAIETVLSKAYKQLVREHKIEVDVKDNAPSISIGSSIEEIKKAILSESEANKDVAFDVKLHVEEIKNVTNEISSEITAKLGSDEKIGSYLNLELFKVINGTSIQLSNLNSKIRMTIAIPTHLLGKEKYSILRYHEGKVEQFNDLDNDPKTITFETDRFSIFALTYTEKTEEEIKPTPVIKPDDSTPVINPDKTTPVVNPEKPSKDVMNQVNTGDTSNKNALLVMMLVAGIAIIIVSKKRKKV